MPRLRDAAFLSLLAVAGCHAAPRPVAPSEPGTVVRARSAGAEIVAAVRPTPGVAHVSVWLDAGSRDATPPQTATLAAWLAAESIGPEVEAVVYPDATQLSRRCPSGELSACVEQLARALVLRDPGEANVARARVRLRDGRRRSLASRPTQAGHVAALTALLGAGATGYFPLGEAVDDERVDAAAVAAFLGAHYGANRALVVAVGDVEPHRVRAAAQQALAHVPKASAARRMPSAPESPPERVRVVIDERNAMTVALLGPSLGRVAGLAQQLQRRLQRGAFPGLQSTASVFGVRGGAIGLLDVSANTVDALLSNVPRELARTLREAPGPQPSAAFTDDLEGVARALAQPWATASSEPVHDVTYGLALVAAGGRAESRAQDPDAALRERMQKRALDALQQALADAAPQIRGTRGEHSASVVTPNGARIEVRRVRGPEVVIAARALRGAGSDPPLLLGRTALLATLTSTACAGLTPHALDAELARLHATLSPRVDAHSYGLLVRAPSAAWQDALDLTLRCMQSPSLEPSHVADALLRLQSRFGDATSALSMRARVASLIAPRAPGVFAPWGEASRLGNLDARALSSLASSTRTGAVSVVAVTGEVPVEDVVQLAASRMCVLPAGALPSVLELGEPSVQSVAPTSSGEPVTVLAVWQTRSTAGDTVAAKVTAAALQTWLARTPGLQVEWRDGDAYDRVTWAALRVRVAPDVLPSLGATLAKVGSYLDEALLADAVQHARSLARASESAAASRLDVMAERVVVERAALTPARQDAQQAIDVARDLTRAQPVFVVID